MSSNTIKWKSVRESILADPALKAEYDALMVS